MPQGDATYLHDIVRESARTIESVSDLEAGILDAASLLVECLRYGGKVLVCGNGGSAADASHFATELLCRFELDRRALPALALTADGSFLSAAGNDYDFSKVFSRQIEGLASPGDVLVAISTSGNSPNVIEAVRTAKERSIKTVTLLGREGGAMLGMGDVELTVPSGVTARIQEAHQVIIHILCGLIDRRLFPSASA